MRRILTHSNVDWAIERDKGEIRQVDLMDLVEDLLPGGRISRLLFLREQGIQLLVTVEGKV